MPPEIKTYNFLDIKNLLSAFETGSYPDILSSEFCQLLHQNSYYELNAETFTENSLYREFAWVMSENEQHRITGAENSVQQTEIEDLFNGAPSGSNVISIFIHSHPYDNKFELEKLVQGETIVETGTPTDFKATVSPKGGVFDKRLKNSAFIYYADTEKDVFLKLNHNMIPKLYKETKTYRNPDGSTFPMYVYSYYISYQPIPSNLDFLWVKITNPKIYPDHYGLVSGNWFIIYTTTDIVVVYDLTTRKKAGIDVGWDINSIDDKNKLVPLKYSQNLKDRASKNFEAYVIERGDGYYDVYNLFYELIRSDKMPISMEGSGTQFLQHPNGFISLTAYQDYV